MTKAKKGDSVKINYTGKLDDGTIFDTSLSSQPLAFTIGTHTLIPGFEAAVVGMKTGETKTVTIAAPEAYGHHRKDLIVAADKNQLPEGMTPEVGQKLQILRDNDTPIPVTIIEITDTKVILDANHPLAGKNLTFDITLLEITSPC